MELRETVTYFYQFIIKNNIKGTDEQSDEKVHKMGSGRTPSVGASVSGVLPYQHVGASTNM